MHECTSVLRVNMWRKRGIVNKLNQGQWFEYIPTHKETVLYPRQLTFNPDGIYPTEEEMELEREIRSHGMLLNEVLDREYSNFEEKTSSTHFNFSGAVHGLSDVKVCRRQNCIVDIAVFFFFHLMFLLTISYRR